MDDERSDQSVQDGPKKENVLLAKWQLMLCASVDPALTKSDIAVLAYILNSINSRTKIAFPALTKISERAYVDRGTATRAIKRLEQFDYLRKKPGDRVKSNEYRMGKGRCESAPRCKAAASCGDAPKVDAGMHHEVDAGMRLQSRKSLSRNVIQEKEHTAQVRSDGEKSDQNGKSMTLEQFIQSVPKGQHIFTEGDPLLAYMRKIKLNRDLIDLAWRAFNDRYRGTANRQVDWRKWFLRFVKGNWGRVWLVQNGSFYLTTVGQQLCLEIEEETGRTLDVEPA